MFNLYKNPLKYNFSQIKIEKVEENDVRVYDNREHTLPELIIMLDGSWSEEHIQKLIHVAQQSAKYAFKNGQEAKQKEIKDVLNIK